ncbi:MULTISPECIES: tryptophan dimethylallyltransferase family protein [Actinoplanes]|uniref:tryptophan dimethylallyltransferase family protein n=1 Tax=Actinoplanes TaxID=1865 RepID=UPI0005F2AFDC|nr:MULTISPECIES: tryptophan dimethylallyltransferase family protein [Actinoplanes]GLY00376.1 prenyltransferase [Actinoplanes sp. NBRC 101535]
MQDPSVLDHLGGQLSRLCEVVGTDDTTPVELLAGVLGKHGSRPLSQPPAWASDVADDHSPVEFSIAWNESEPPALRILAEALGPVPSVSANMAATYDFLRANGVSTSRLDAVRDLFDVAAPEGDFAIWLSLVFRNGRRPEFKVYFNPEVLGRGESGALAGEAFERLGLGTAYQKMVDRAVRPGELGGLDRLSFFALDLHDAPHARVKLYVSHHDATAADVARAAGVVDGVDPAEVADFCRLAGGEKPKKIKKGDKGEKKGKKRGKTYTGRPLISSFTLTGASDEPAGYSVYVPIRSYVGDDREARRRVVPLLDRYRFDPDFLDRGIAAVTRRPLDSGVGLLAHVSLRLGPPRPGMTVYLSSEAYRVDPPRPLPISVI